MKKLFMALFAALAVAFAQAGTAPAKPDYASISNIVSKSADPSMYKTEYYEYGSATNLMVRMIASETSMGQEGCAQDVFLCGEYIELGLHRNGAFGTKTKPDTKKVHAWSGQLNTFGMRASMTGWGDKNTYMNTDGYVHFMCPKCGYSTNLTEKLTTGNIRCPNLACHYIGQPHDSRILQHDVGGTLTRDFFTPATKDEGWLITTGGTFEGGNLVNATDTARGQQGYNIECSGLNLDKDSTALSAKVYYKGNGGEPLPGNTNLTLIAQTELETDMEKAGFKITQVVAFSKYDTGYDTWVTISNTTAETKANVCYFRGFNPDQPNKWYQGGRNNTDNFYYTDEITHDAFVICSATNYQLSTIASLVDVIDRACTPFIYYAPDPRNDPQVAHKYTITPVSMSGGWSTSNNFSTPDNGYHCPGDIAMGLRFNIGDLGPDESVRLYYYSSLDPCPDRAMKKLSERCGDPTEYVEPVYKSAYDATSGIDHWETNTTYGCTVVTDATTPVTWNAGWYLVTNEVKITGGVSVYGNVNLILGDGASLWVTNETVSCAGIAVNEGHTLAIYGQKEGTGRLTVFGNNMYAAAIGSDKNKDSGAITVNGGIVTATGGKQGAGIGGGDGAVGGGQGPKGGKGQNITVNGGTVTATGGWVAAGIGGGACGTAENIILNGGTITATGDTDCAGIGTGVSAQTAASRIYANNQVAIMTGGAPNWILPIKYTQGEDLATKLAHRYVTVKSPAVCAINAAGYMSLGEAFYAAEDGDTVKLLGDLTSTATMIYENKFPDLGCALDLDGHTLMFNTQGHMYGETIKDGLSIWSNNVFTVKHGTLTTTTGAGLRDVMRFYGTKLVLDRVTLDGTNIPAGLTTKANAVLTVESGTCFVEASTITAPTGASDNTLYAIKFGNHSHPEYTMGTLSVARSTVTGDLLLNGGSYDEMDALVSGRYFYGRNRYSVWESASDLFVARTGVLPETGAEDNFVGQLYKSFADALAAAQTTEDGDTVTLLKDVANDQDVTLDTPTVIDAADHTYTSTGSLTLDVTKTAATPFTHLGTGSSCSAGPVTCIGKVGYEAVIDENGNLTYGIPNVQLGAVAQRYPWNGILDVNYRTQYTPADQYTLKLKVEVEGNAKEATCTAASGVGATTVDLREAFGEVKGQAKITATLDNDYSDECEVAIDTRERIVVGDPGEVLPIAYSTNNWGTAEDGNAVLIDAEYEPESGDFRRVVTAKDNGYAEWQPRSGIYGEYRIRRIVVEDVVPLDEKEAMIYYSLPYTLTINAPTEGGTIAVTNEGAAVQSGTSILGYTMLDLAATPAVNWQFEAWNVTTNGVDCGGALGDRALPVTTCEMPNADAVLTASFIVSDDYVNEATNALTTVYNDDIAYLESILTGDDLDAAKADLKSVLDNGIAAIQAARTPSAVTEALAAAQQALQETTDKHSKFAITYDAMGGAWDDGSETNVVDSYVKDGYTLPEIDPTRADYSFIGWFTNWQESATEAVANGQPLAALAAHTLYAKWTPDTSNPNTTKALSEFLPSGEPRLEIAEEEFKGDRTVKTLDMPLYVTSIGAQAFRGASALTTVNFVQPRTYADNEKTTLTIGDYAFLGATGLKSVTIPAYVTSIGAYAFSGCSTLTEITFLGDLDGASLGNAPFINCGRAVGGITIRLSPRAAANTDLVYSITNGATAKVVIDARLAGEINPDSYEGFSVGGDTLSFQLRVTDGTPVTMATVSALFAETPSGLSAGEYLEPREITVSGDVYTIVFDKPKAGQGFLRLCIIPQNAL